MLSIYSGHKSIIRHMFYKAFAACDLSFHFLNSVFQSTKVTHFNWVQLINIFPFMMCAFYVFQTILCLTHHHEDFLLYSLLEILALKFRSMIYFKVILYKECDKVEVLFIVLTYPIAPWYLCWKSNDCFVWVHSRLWTLFHWCIYWYLSLSLKHIILINCNFILSLKIK